MTSIILGRGALILEKRVTKERRVIVDPSGLVPTVRCARVSLVKQKRVFDRDQPRRLAHRGRTVWKIRGDGAASPIVEAHESARRVRRHQPEWR